MQEFDLFNYDVNEVSFVDNGAVKESFLILKRGNRAMKELIEKLSKVEIPADEIKELVEKHKLSDEDKDLLTAMLAIPKASDKVLKVFMETLKEDEPGKAAEGDGDKSGEGEPGKDNSAAINEDEKKEEIEKALKDTKAEKEKLEKRLEAIEAESLKKGFVVKAETFKNSGMQSGELANLLIEISKGVNKETFDKLDNMLKSYEAAVEKSALFDEKGTSAEGDTSDALKSIEKMAKARSVEKKMTYERAYTEIIRENPELYEKL